MIAKLISIVTGTLTKDEVISRLKDNPRTTGLGAVVTALVGAAYALYDKGMLIGCGLCAGAAAMVAIVGLMLGVDAPKDPPGPAA